MYRFLFTALLSAFVLSSCSSDKRQEEIEFVEEEISDIAAVYSELGKTKLSEYHFFKAPIAELRPGNRVYPYELNTPLFTDYAQKSRFVYIPEGEKIYYREREVLGFPVGAVLIKNFYYDNTQVAAEKGKIIETRLLIRDDDGWKALPYIWNEEQTDAFLEITGGVQSVMLKNKKPFQYSIPNMAQCKSCHEYNGAVSPVGPSARQLNKIVNGKNQLKYLEEQGVLTGMPDMDQVERLAVWDLEESGSLDERASAYLEINCGHCHRPEGPAKNSGLDLTTFSPTDHALGIFKAPVAAGAGSGGLRYDIVPGQAENSILIYRMASTDPGIMMPELGRKLVHEEGLSLIKEWINAMNAID